MRHYLSEKLILVLRPKTGMTVITSSFQVTDFIEMCPISKLNNTKYKLLEI